MQTLLSRIADNLGIYRASIDRLLASDLSAPHDVRKCFLDILISVSEIYLSYAILCKESATFTPVRTDEFSSKIRGIDIQREAQLRERLRKKCESVPVWKSFDADDALAEMVGLTTLQDYLNSFGLHLPEIYEESLHLTEAVAVLLTRPEDSAFGALVVGMEHIARNHISFVQPALDRAADEGHWW